MPPDGAAAVREIVAGAEDIGPDYEMNVQRLAALPRHEYDGLRKTEAARLGVRLTTLDLDIDRARNGGADIPAPGQGRALILPDPKPWSNPVDGARLLEMIVAGIRRHVVLGAVEADAAALWTVAVHAVDAWSIFPRLFIGAMGQGCGKSTMLDVLSRLVPRPLGASHVTAASLFRVVEAMRPTLLLDEADAYARNNEDLRAVLDAGHRRDGAVIRTVGDDHEPRQFSAWAPVALAAIGTLPGTVQDRSITIRLRRRRADEPIEPLRNGRADELAELARMAARWTGDHAAALAAADPVMPAGIINRCGDNWAPLISVADLACGDWPIRARHAAVALSAGQDGESLRVTLLRDIWAAFEARGTDRLSSDELAAYLGGLEDRRWPEYRAGRPITKPQLARLLRPFHISPGTIRLPDGRTPKGYHRAAFADAVERYCGASAENPKRHNATSRGNAEDSDDFRAPQRESCGVSESAGDPQKHRGCGVVAFSGTDQPKRDGSPYFSTSVLADLATGEFDPERAAIAEFSGGLPRADAELIARLPDRPPVGMTEADLDELIAQLENET